MSRGINDLGVASSSREVPEEATQRFRKRSVSGLNSGGSTNSRSRDPELPKSGDQIFGFHLGQELGRGAFARVFLAGQENLAGRPVVLKVSGIDGDEPQTLAQLQHTHIVPIYSVHEDEAVGLRGVCMPYFGGASLSMVLEKLFSDHNRPSQGEQMVRALAAVGAPRPSDVRPFVEGRKSVTAESTNHRGPSALDMLERESYFRVVAWLGSRLAEGLQHAHHRGVIHRDVKPSNVLLGSDGQPMLLDFNVSSNENENPGKVVLGGTVAYMSPEHLQAMIASERGKAVATDHRSDIYSLGMVLYEMLVGTRPFEQTGSYSAVMPQLLAMALERSQHVPSLRAHRPDAPWGLESIIRKCLLPVPNLRYQYASELAEDLRRYLEDLPLKHAPELSFRESAAKWLRRHPRLASSGSVATAAILILAGGAVAFQGVRQHLQETSAALAFKEAQERRQIYAAGTLRALCLVNTLADVADHRHQGMQVCEETLAIYGVLGREDWQNHAGWEHFEAAERQKLAEDTRELLLLLACGRVAEKPRDAETLRTSLALLDRAEAITDLPPSRALREERAYLLEKLGEQEAARTARAEAAGMAPASARDYYLLATAYSREGRYGEAIEELDRAIELNPRHYWSWMQRGICRQEMGALARAESDYAGCIALWPEHAWGHFNRGYVRELQGSRREAISDYTAALKRDPRFVAAYLNRGMAFLEIKDYEAAIADLRQAQESGRDDAPVHAGLAMALEGLKRFEEADAEFQIAFIRAEAAPEKVQCRTRWAYGFSVARRRPAEARAAFDEVLRRWPAEPHGLYGRGMMLAGDGHLGEAISCFTKALEIDPTMSEPRRFRAILLAKSGKFPEALTDLNWFFERRLEDGSVYYATACVTALWREKLGESAEAKNASDQALSYLEKALARGYGRDIASEDEDLRSLRNEPRFAQLLAPTRMP